MGVKLVSQYYFSTILVPLPVFFILTSQMYYGPSIKILIAFEQEEKEVAFLFWSTKCVVLAFLLVLILICIYVRDKLLNK